MTETNEIIRCVPNHSGGRPLAVAEIYRRLMLWLEGRDASQYANAAIIKIPVEHYRSTMDNDPPTVTMRALRFRRGKGMGETMWAESLDMEGFRVHYDPNWETLDKLEKLLEGK